MMKVSNSFMCHLMLNHLNIFDIIQLSLTCKRFDTIFQMFVTEPEIIKKFGAEDKYQLFKKIGDDTAIELGHESENIFDIALVFNMDEWMNNIRLTREQYNIAKMFFANENIAKHAGLFNDASFIPSSDAERYNYSLGILKSGGNPPFVNENLFIKFIKYERADLIKKHMNFCSKKAISYALLTRKTKMSLLLAESFHFQKFKAIKTANDAIEFYPRKYKINHYLKKCEYEKVLEFIMQKDIRHIKIGVGENFLKYLNRIDHKLRIPLGQHICMLAIMKKKKPIDPSTIRLLF